ncbi:peptidylprolyl isomerase [Sphingomonas nostoxanthinifaciens]|uniref:peptidylprolyl isomerase n=1 Tax=Sphingomonas nostoxanthinifaciens TaxID=2872652 RepID=UPI001CC2188E|nr:peptidylprolyl isomerase [Sphingomonas nostoxanthinifaciens]UAK26549.1 peptidylprolyl isomerase [Sphingomonas nostoxanthinifaciens]
MIRTPFSLLAASLLATSAPTADPVTPGMIVERAPTADWAPVAPEDLLLIDLAGGGQVAIALAPEFAPVHVANIRTIARAGWYDGLAIDRVQDDYVTQWGDADGHKPSPPGIVAHPAAEYDRAAAGLTPVPLPYRDSYAPATGFVGAFPVAADGDRAWMTHCYGIVGVGRDMAPDTGNGQELYAVIGHAPRALDRNVALVGRVVAGMELLSALPRGSGALGFYADPKQRVAIARVRIAADLPPAERPAYQWLRPESASFAAWVKLRANRDDAFFRHPAGAVDLCNALPPVRPAPRS